MLAAYIAYHAEKKTAYFDIKALNDYCAETVKADPTKTPMTDTLKSMYNIKIDEVPAVTTAVPTGGITTQRQIAFQKYMQQKVRTYFNNAQYLWYKYGNMKKIAVLGTVLALGSILALTTIGGIHNVVSDMQGTPRSFWPRVKGTHRPGF